MEVYTDRGTSGRLFWWSGASAYILLAADLGGMAPWRIDVRCAKMDSRKEVKLSGVLVGSTAARSGKVDATVHH